MRSVGIARGESRLLPTYPRNAFASPARGGSRVIPAKAGIQ